MSPTSSFAGRTDSGPAGGATQSLRAAPTFQVSAYGPVATTLRGTWESGNVVADGVIESVHGRVAGSAAQGLRVPRNPAVGTTGTARSTLRAVPGIPLSGRGRDSGPHAVLRTPFGEGENDYIELPTNKRHEKQARK